MAAIACVRVLISCCSRVGISLAESVRLPGLITYSRKEFEDTAGMNSVPHETIAHAWTNE